MEDWGFWFERKELCAQGQHHLEASFPGKPGSGLLSGSSGDTCSTSLIRPSAGRPQTHLGVPSGLAAGRKQQALNSAFVQ